MVFVFFLNDSATHKSLTYGHTLSLHDALPIFGRAEVEKQFEGYGKDAAEKFLAEAGLTPDAARKVSHMIEHGVPEALLRDYAENSRRHLTVVGTHGGGMVYETLIGSTARKIIDAVPGDVLLVPDPAKRKAD